MDPLLSVPVLWSYVRDLVHSGQTQIHSSVLYDKLNSCIIPSLYSSTLERLPMGLLHAICSYLWVEDHVLWGLCNSFCYRTLIQHPAAWSTLCYRDVTASAEAFYHMVARSSRMHRIVPHVKRMELYDNSISSHNLSLRFGSLSSLLWDCAPIDAWDYLTTLPVISRIELCSAGGYMSEPKLTATHCLNTVRTLALRTCRYSSADFLRSMTHLTTLSLDHVTFDDDQILHLSTLKDLQHLSLTFCTKLKRLTDLQVHTKLLSLNLRFCTSLDDLTGLKDFTSLQTLELSYVPSYSLVDLRQLSVLKSLTTLDVSGTKLRTLKGIQTFKHLRHLDLSRTQVQHLTPLAGLNTLEQFSFSYAHIKSSYQSLQTLTSLKVLRLDYSNIKEHELHYCSNLSQLQYLNVKQQYPLALNIPLSVRNLPLLEESYY